MIKINLLGEDQVAGNSNHLFQIVSYIGSVVVLLVVLVIAHSSLSGSVESLTSEKSGLDKRLADLKIKTKEVRDLEGKQKELTNMLTVIALLKKSKNGPVRVLDDLNIALPARAWLTEMIESANAVRLVGMALDNQTIASFMEKLEASDYFENVALEESKSAVVDNIPIKSFIIRSKISYSGKFKMPTDELSGDNEGEKKKAPTPTKVPNKGQKKGGSDE